MKRKRQNDIPAKTKMATGLFKTHGPGAGAQPYNRGPAMNPKARNGAPHSGLTRNRQKPGGGAGSGGPTTQV